MTEKIEQAKKLLAQNIKVLRKDLGFSQEKLAEITELSTQTISDIEGCRTWVSDKTLEKLAKVLNVDIFQLFVPINEDNTDESTSFLYKRLTKLGNSIKDDIDKRLNQFFSLEKSLNN
ncbi:MAG: helix-turn-helix domain-containing protein [Treponema sp.]|nr:helix-turn-helix domain-containing protein [Treponema sp.]